MTEGWADVLAGQVVRAAPRLLGAELVSDVGRSRVAVRLVEVEAYSGVGDDPGSHAHRGRTRRNETMFGPPGHSYVYFTYGMHWCLNVVCGPVGVASGVLLRAAEVVDGHAVARARRGAARDRDLARGPARLAQALGVTGDLDGVDLLASTSPVRLGAVPTPAGGAVRTGPRVGVAGAGAPTPWRFWLADEPTVSTYRPAQPRRRSGPGSGSLAP